MKTQLRLFLGIICLLFFLGTAYANCFDCRCPCRPKPQPPPPQIEKQYLDSSDIEILENKILVKLNNEIVPAIALFSDNQGIYVLTKKRQGRCPEEYWECDTCGGCSPWYASECDWCGYD